MYDGRALSQVFNHSIQFNCLCRWHATTSKEDEKWVELMSSRTFPGKETDEVRSSSLFLILSLAYICPPVL